MKKQKLLGSLVFLACALSSFNAQAKTHKAKNKVSPAQKQADVVPVSNTDNMAPLSAEEKAALNPAPTPSTWGDKFEVGWKKGLFFKSKDDKFSMKMKLRIQAQHQFRAVDAASTDSNTFKIRRAKLSFDGNAFTPNLKYKFQLSVATSNFTDMLEDAYVSYTFNKPFTLTAGQFKIPYNRQQMTSSGAQQMIDRSLASDEFRFASLDSGATSYRRYHYDLGLMLSGSFLDEKIDYNLAVLNGNGPNRINGNNEFLYVGRLAWNILGKYGFSEADTENSEHPHLLVGASVGYNSQELTSAKVLQAGAELGFKYKGASLQSEFYLRDTNPVGTSPNRRDYGYYVQAGYFAIPKKFEVVGRASQVFLAESNKTTSGFAFESASSEFAGGLNYYFFGHDLKLQAEYAYMPRSGSNLKDHRTRLQLQAAF